MNSIDLNGHDTDTKEEEVERKSKLHKYLSSTCSVETNETLAPLSPSPRAYLRSEQMTCFPLKDWNPTSSSPGLCSEMRME